MSTGRMIFTLSLLALAACGGSRTRTSDAPLPEPWPTKTQFSAPGTHATSSESVDRPTASQKSKEHAAAQSSARTYSTADVVKRAAECGTAVQSAQSGNITVSVAADTCRDAASVAETACSQGDREGCALAKSMRDVGAAIPLIQQARAQKTCAASSVRECEAMCDGGDLDTCVEVGTMYTQGTRVSRDFGRGTGILRSACDKGSMRACYIRGASLMVADSGAAATSLRTACESDSVTWSDVSCGMLINMLDRGSYKPSDTEKEALLQKMCDREKSSGHTHGAANACGRLKDLSSASLPTALSGETTP